MKKRFSVEFLLFLLVFILISCASSARSTEQIVATSIKLAEEKVRRNLPWQAIDIYKKASAEITDYRILYNEALVYAKLGLYSEAAGICREARESFPEEKTLLSALSNYNALNGSYTEAKECYEEYLALYPDDNQIRTQFMLFCNDNSYSDEAYENAMILWNKKIYNSDVVKVLYSSDPDQWEVMHKIFPDKSETE